MINIEIPHMELQFGKKNLRLALRQAGQLVMTTARALTGNSAGSGHVYTIPQSIGAGQHTASAPGQPPALLSGKLNDSLSLKATGNIVVIRDPVYYAKFLETGASGGGRARSRARKNGSSGVTRKMEPRPFLSTALEANRPAIEKLIIDGVDRDLELKD